MFLSNQNVFIHNFSAFHGHLGKLHYDKVVFKPFLEPIKAVEDVFVHYLITIKVSGVIA